MIWRVLYPEKEYNGEDSEDDEPLGHNVVQIPLPVVYLKYVRVSYKFFIGTADTEVPSKIWKKKRNVI